RSRPPDRRPHHRRERPPDHRPRRPPPAPVAHPSGREGQARGAARRQGSGGRGDDGAESGRRGEPKTERRTPTKRAPSGRPPAADPRTTFANRPDYPARKRPFSPSSGGKAQRRRRFEDRLKKMPLGRRASPQRHREREEKDKF